MAGRIRPLTMTLERLRSSPPEGCAICGARQLTTLGSKDFGHSGNDAFIGARTFPDYAVPVPYFQCQQCRFVFTPVFDDWTEDDFSRHVYNGEYALADPPFLGERARRNAVLLEALYRPVLGSLELLDIGGGSGLLTDELALRGVHATSHDPHFGANEPLPQGKTYPLITSFEVVEHVRHGEQYDWLRRVVALMEPSTFAHLLISTELTPPDVDLSWWYMCPRNGHVSLHSAQSLAIWAEELGLQVSSLHAGLHLLQRRRTGGR